MHNLILIGENYKRKDTYTPTLATVGKVSISKSKELINAFLIIWTSTMSTIVSSLEVNDNSPTLIRDG